MTEPSKAVFLSYASEDAEAAQRIADALRPAGIEVWFDKSELRGGDAWDHKIRTQVRDCALFMPVISAHTQARPEGYFRLEWDVADQRSHMIGRSKAFLVPVCIDKTVERDADVPDSFLKAQWTRLPGGETSATFADRVRALLSSSGPSEYSQTGAKQDFAIAPKQQSRRWIVVAVACLLLILVGGWLAWRIVMPKSGGATGNAAATGNERAGTVLSDNSVAVLPLRNESGDPKQEYFSDGLSEDLITALSHVPELKVIGRTSSFRFKNSQEDSTSIGRKLGVAHLVEGSVRRDAQTVRVNAELIHTADGSTLWSEQYDRPYKNLFALQDEITLAVAGALKTRLLPGTQTPALNDRPPSGSLEAYNAYLQGKYFYSRNSEQDTRNAITQFTRATQLDLRYAAAWSGLSRSWTFLGLTFLEGDGMTAAYARARAAAESARNLAPDTADTHAAWGMFQAYVEFNQHDAEESFRRALEQAPGDDELMAELAGVLARLGRPGEAAMRQREALVLNPLSVDGYISLAGYLAALGRLDEAEEAARRATALEPTAEPIQSTLVQIEVLKGNAQAALEAAKKINPGAYRDVSLAAALQIGGDRAAADAALKAAIRRDAGIAAYQIAEIYALRGDVEKTFEWLDRAWENRDTGILFLLNDPFIRRYKDDPRFAALCRKVGLPVPGEKQMASK